MQSIAQPDLKQVNETDCPALSKHGILLVEVHTVPIDYGGLQTRKSYDPPPRKKKKKPSAILKDTAKFQAVPMDITVLSASLTAANS